MAQLAHPYTKKAHTFFGTANDVTIHTFSIWLIQKGTQRENIALGCWTSPCAISGFSWVISFTQIAGTSWHEWILPFPSAFQRLTVFCSPHSLPLTSLPDCLAATVTMNVVSLLAPSLSCTFFQDKKLNFPRQRNLRRSFHNKEPQPLLLKWWWNHLSLLDMSSRYHFWTHSRFTYVEWMKRIWHLFAILIFFKEFKTAF